ncbi:hypothetical protein [Zoogloea oleivorans]|uniref:hypothetical protein n=1 Tax=Zoogloea oleivorans TaxID=1552750 RepID=UPI002A364B97|nr:hypothetical protein [Zoogloea oleivorans]
MHDFDADLNSVWGELAEDAPAEDDQENSEAGTEDEDSSNPDDAPLDAQGADEAGDEPGDDSDGDPLDGIDISLLEEIADEGGQHRHQAAHENVIPAPRVAQLIDQIRSYADAAGVDAPDFGDPVAMPASDFKELTTTRDRLRIRAAAAQVEMAEPHEPAAREPQQAPQEPAFDVVANRRAVHEAFLDGDLDRVEQLEREYHEYNERRLQQARDEAAHTASERVKQDVLQAQARETYKSELRRIVEENAFLSDNNFDNPAADEMTQWCDFYTARGKSDIEALRLAADRVLPLYQTQPARQPTPATGQKPAKPDPRQAKAVERAASVSRAQPPVLDAGLGERAVPSLPDVENMDPDEWARLPEKERMRLLA